MDQLPTEIIAHILDFVDPPDVERASYVCRSWFEASLHPRLVKTLFIGRKTRCNSATVSQSSFTQDNSTLRLTIQGREKGDDLSWNNANANYPPGNEVKSLVITTDRWVSPYLYVVILNDILSKFQEIEDLELRHINMHVGFRGDVSLSTHLQNLVMLKLAFIENLPNFIFGPTMGYLPQIKSLTLESEVHFSETGEIEVHTAKKKSVLHIREFKRICNEYWEILDEIDVTYSRLTEDNMQELCNRLHPNIQTIKLSRCAYIDDAALNILSCTVRPRVLKIDSFLYSSNITGNGVAAVGIRMNSVEYLALYINEYIRLNDDLFESGFLGLDSFYMTSNGERSNYCLVKLSKKKLCIENFCKIDGTDLLISLSRGSPNLQELSLDLICQITNRDIFIIAEKFPNIRILKLNSCCELTDKCFIGIDEIKPMQNKRPNYRERHGARSRGRTGGIAANFGDSASNRMVQLNRSGPSDSVAGRTSRSYHEASVVTVNGELNGKSDSVSYGEQNVIPDGSSPARSGFTEHSNGSKRSQLWEATDTSDDRESHTLNHNGIHPITGGHGVQSSNGHACNASLQHSTTRVCDRSDCGVPTFDQVTRSPDNYSTDVDAHSNESPHDHATHSRELHDNYNPENGYSFGLSGISENHSHDGRSINLSDRSASMVLSNRQVGQWLQHKLNADTKRKNQTGCFADSPDCAGGRSGQCSSWNGLEGYVNTREEMIDRYDSAPPFYNTVTNNLTGSNTRLVNGTQPGSIEADGYVTHPSQNANEHNCKSHDRYSMDDLGSSQNKQRAESDLSGVNPNYLDDDNGSSHYRSSEISFTTEKQGSSATSSTAAELPSTTSADHPNGRADTGQAMGHGLGDKSLSSTNVSLDSYKSDSGERNMSTRSLPVESVTHSPLGSAISYQKDSRRTEERKEAHKCLQDLKQLETLCLVGCCEVSDVALSRAIVFPLLTYLKLTHCDNLTDRGIEAITNNNPKLSTFILEFCRQITDDSVESVIKNLKPSLKRAKFENCGRLTGIGLKHVSSFHGDTLTEVYIGGCPVTRPEIEEFKETTPTVKFEDFDW